MTGTYTPGMKVGAQVLNDGVGCLVTTGVEADGQTVVLHLNDRFLDRETYALLTPHEARTVAQHLIEMAAQAEAGAS